MAKTWRKLLIILLSSSLASGLLYFCYTSFSPASVATAPGVVQSAAKPLVAAASRAASSGPANAARQPVALDDALCVQLSAANQSTQSSQLSDMENAAQDSARTKAAALLGAALRSPDLPQRVAALLLDTQLQADAIPRAMKAKIPGCIQDEACERQMRTNVSHARDQNTNEVARLAISSRDPLVYASAFYACNYWDKSMQSADGYCQQISASQWAERDPDNGVAWLHVAQQAVQANKPAELDNAMFRLSRVKTFALRRVGLAQLRDPIKLAQQETRVQIELASLSNAAANGGMTPQFKLAADYCKRSKLQDPNRRQICEGIATGLLADRQILLSGSIGAGIASRLGWPESKIRQLMEVHDAILALDMEATPAPSPVASGPGSALVKRCHDSFFQARYVMDSMESGEMEKWRQMIAQHRLSQAQLAARYRAGDTPEWASKTDD